MSEQKKQIGSIGWVDLTVDDADNIRDFYSEVTGWQPEPVSMGEYNDYNMKSPDTGQPVTGICHKRGGNSELPSQWLIYIMVANLDESIEACKKLGGKVLMSPKNFGESSRYAIIADPAGAVAALWE